MNYVILETQSIIELSHRVNDYDRLGWHPIGGLTAVRNTVSGPPTFYQAVFKASNGASPQVQPSKKPRGRPRKEKPKEAQP